MREKKNWSFIQQKKDNSDSYIGQRFRITQLWRLQGRIRNDTFLLSGNYTQLKQHVHAPRIKMDACTYNEICGSVSSKVHLYIPFLLEMRHSMLQCSSVLNGVTYQFYSPPPNVKQTISEYVPTYMINVFICSPAQCCPLSGIGSP